MQDKLGYLQDNLTLLQVFIKSFLKVAFLRAALQIIYWIHLNPASIADSTDGLVSTKSNFKVAGSLSMSNGVFIHSWLSNKWATF